MLAAGAEAPTEAAILAAAAHARESASTVRAQDGDVGLIAIPWLFVGRHGAYVLGQRADGAVAYLERTIARSTKFARAESALEALGEGMLLVDAQGTIEVATLRAATMLETTSEALEGQALAPIAPGVRGLEPGEVMRGALLDRPVSFTAQHRTRDSGAEDGSLIVRLRSDERFAVTRQRQLQLLSILRHDVRSPLTSLRGLVGVLLDEPDMPRDERVSLLALLRQEAERTVTWVEDYLVALRLRLDPRPQHTIACDLAGILGVIENVFGAHAEERQIGLTIEPCAIGVAKVTAEPPLLDAFVKNLVGHAFRLADAGATIHVRVAPDHALEVSARGSGLFGAPPRQPFTTLSRSTAAGKRTPSVGLGLFLAKKIADAHGWLLEVRATAEPGLSIRASWTHPGV